MGVCRGPVSTKSPCLKRRGWPANGAAKVWHWGAGKSERDIAHRHRLRQTILALSSHSEAATPLRGPQRGMTMQNPAREGDPCPKCGTALRVVLCGPCYGTGRSGKRCCKTCGGTGVAMACPNFRSHRLWPGTQKPLVQLLPSGGGSKMAWWNAWHGLAGRLTNPFRGQN
jgi:hypothetical protein